MTGDSSIGDRTESYKDAGVRRPVARAAARQDAGMDPEEIADDLDRTPGLVDMLLEELDETVADAETLVDLAGSDLEIQSDPRPEPPAGTTDESAVTDPDEDDADPDDG